MPRIRPVSDLREYFRQTVAAALQRNDVEVDPPTSSYVGDLLALYARSEALFEQGERGDAGAFASHTGIAEDDRAQARSCSEIGWIAAAMAAANNDAIARFGWKFRCRRRFDHERQVYVSCDSRWPTLATVFNVG